MAQQVTRVGDQGQGVCPLHDSPVAYTTTFTTGSSTTTADGMPVCIVGSLGLASCGHQTIALTGSSVSTSNGQPIHRVGDTGKIVGAGEGSGGYVVTTGSPTVSSD